MATLSNHELWESWTRPLLLIAVVLGWVSFLYSATLWSMVSTWERSETFAHGFLVLPISLWLVWRQRDSLAGFAPHPAPSAAWLLLAIGIVWLLGNLAAANAVSQLAYVAMLVLCVAALLGWPLVKKLAFPLGFLFFAVPIGDFLTAQFMEWTARFTVLGLRLSGVPVYRNGMEFVIPSGTWSVVEACSGIRYLIASVMVGTLFAYLNFRSLPRRLAFIAVAVAVPVIANWVRAYAIVMIGHLSENRLATGIDHLIYGWLFFGVVMLLMFLIGSRWAEPGEAVAGGDGGAAKAPDASFDPARGNAGWAALAVALVAALPVLATRSAEQFNRAGAPVLDKDPAALADSGWRAVPDGDSAWQPAFQGAPSEWRQVFEKEGRQVAVYIGYYRNQDYERKLLSSSNALVRSDDPTWILETRGPRLADVGGSPLTVNEARLQPRFAQTARQPRAVWQWYWVAGRLTASPAWARAYGIWSRLLGQGDDAAVITLDAPAGEGEAALAEFARSAGPAVAQLLDETRKRR
ncbi:MAG: xrtA [Rhodocyclaceae bacterium]|nr:xrtA [Rhodocyclaceae bacterium]